MSRASEQWCHLRSCVCKLATFLTTSLSNLGLEITGEGGSHLGTRGAIPGSKTGRSY